MSRDKLISVLVPSRRLHQLDGLIKSLQENTKNPKNIELVCKFDSDMENAEEYIKKIAKTVDFDIKYIISERLGGVFTLWVGCNELFNISNPSSYFIFFITDEGRFLTKNWDEILQKYRSVYSDNLFRLRLSSLTRHYNYVEAYECVYSPESFPIYTRKWLELSEGPGNCWGGDAYHQLIAFHLSLGTTGYKGVFRQNVLHRDIPCEDIQIGGTEVFAQDIPLDQRECYNVRNELEWMRLVTYEMQLHFAYIARRMYLYVYAHQHNLKKFQIIKKEYEKIVQLYDIDNNSVTQICSYDLSKSYIFLYNINIYIRFIFNYITFYKKFSYVKELFLNIKKNSINGIKKIPIPNFFKKNKKCPKNVPLGLEKLFPYPGCEWLVAEKTHVLKRIFIKILYKNLFSIMRKTKYPIPNHEEMQKALFFLKKIEEKYQSKVFINENFR